LSGIPAIPTDHSSGVARLALGTAQFGLPYGIANRRGQVPASEVRAILACARDAGVDTLDTAIMYGDSERALGEAGVDGWRVVTKLPAFPEEVPDLAAWARAEVAAALGRLRRSRLDALLLHRCPQILGPRGDELLAAVRQLQDDGLATKIGVSIYGPDELDTLMPMFPFGIVQVPFSVLDRRLATSGWLPRLANQGVEIHVRSLFLQGLLLMPSADRPPSFARWRPLWERWADWLAETGLTPLQACLRFALATPGIARAIVGIDSLGQLREILAAADGAPPPIPADLACADPDLINPSRWSQP
jgi:aryl-alcohol dehydrogenase-like predicted oxidoreductase